MRKSKKERSTTLAEGKAPPTAPTMLTVEQLAERWNLDVKTIYTAVADGQLPALRFGRKRIIRIPVAVVQALETQGRALPSEKL